MQELFKAFARYLSHLLAEGRIQGKGQGKAGGGHSLEGWGRACEDLPETVRVCARSQSRSQSPHQELLQPGAALPERDGLEGPQNTAQLGDLEGRGVMGKPHISFHLALGSPQMPDDHFNGPVIIFKAQR